MPLTTITTGTASKMIANMTSPIRLQKVPQWNEPLKEKRKCQ